MHGLDHALRSATVVECATDRSQAARQRAIADDLAFPQRSEQLIARDHPIASLDQIDEYVELLRVDAHCDVVAPQAERLGVDEE